MALWYVRSAATGTAAGTSWVNAKLTIAAGCTAAAAGDTIYVSEDHAETISSGTNTIAATTSTNPQNIICVNHAGSVPPVAADLATTATVSTTGTAVLAMTGNCYCYGITFVSGVSPTTFGIGSGTVSNVNVFENCALNLQGALALGAATNYECRLINTSIKFALTTSMIRVQGRLIWQNSTAFIAGSTIPATLFQVGVFRPGYVICEGVDFSASTSALVAGASDGNIIFKDCKFNASSSMTGTLTGQGSVWIDFTRCSSAAGNAINGRNRYEGVQTTETTIVRTGGASDGTTAVANKIVTSANSKKILPFEAMPIAIWNDTAGSAVTVTVYGIWGGGAVPNNDDIWFDLEYLGASGNPQGSFATCGVANQLATHTALPSDTSTWGGSTTKFKMSVTVTPQQKGVMYVYVKAATASTTFYIDPYAYLS